MKKIIDTITLNGGTAQVQQSLYIFLKFISSVVPTIEYDFTVDIELDWIILSTQIRNNLIWVKSY